SSDLFAHTTGRQTTLIRGSLGRAPREGVVHLSEERRKVGSVAYREASPAYFAKRALKRHAAFWSLWSLGVAAVISGDFYGWNLGLGVGGFGGLLIATVVQSLFNVHGDPWWNTPYVWFIVSYIVFVGINIRGIVATMRFTVAINAIALGILAVFFLSVIFSGKLNFSLLTNIPPQSGQSWFLPFGLAGIFPAIPFAIWLYLAIEELPLAAEASHGPKPDIPRAAVWGLTT